MDSFLLEACVDSVESAMIATGAGAGRLELCSNLMIGGTTPTLPFFREVQRHCSNRIHVLLRPRFGDFCYSSYEFSVLKEEVRQFRDAGAQGIVIGILKPDGRLDLPRMEQLMAEAGDMSVTLHRAFDVCADPMGTLKEAADLGIHTILTSGQKDNCLEGAELLRRMVEESAGTVDILVGSGVNASVIERLLPITGARSYHMSGKKVLDSPMVYRKKGVSMGLPAFSEYEIWQTEEDAIREAAEVLMKYGK